MSRAIVGGLLGGGAATVYLRPDLVVDFAKDKAVQGLLNGRNYSTSAGNSREIEQLAKLVEQLAQDVKNSKQGNVTIVQQGSGRSGSYMVYAVVVAGLGMAYLVVFKGWRVTDFFYVTRRGLKQGLETVNKGLDEVRGRLDHVKAVLQEKIGVLMRKQDAAMAHQKELQSQLHVVGEDVDTIRSQVGQIHGLVLDVTSGLTEVGANQRHANQGIYILCKAVGELMQNSTISNTSKKELIEYTQHPIWTADKLQGLEGILCHISDNTDTRRGGMLLEGAPAGRKALPLENASVGGAPLEVEEVHLQQEQPHARSASMGGGFGSSNGYGSGGYGNTGSYGSGGGGRGGVQQSSSFTFGTAQPVGPSRGSAPSPPFGTSSGGGGIILSGVAARGGNYAMPSDPW